MAFLCNIKSLLLKYSNEQKVAEVCNSKPPQATPRVLTEQILPENKENEENNEYEFLWNVPKEFRKDVLRERLSYAEFVQIFGREYKRIKFQPQCDLKITIPHPFTFSEPRENIKKHYEYYLEQTLIELEESKKPPEYKPFIAKEVPKNTLEARYELLRIEAQCRKLFYKKNSKIIRTRTHQKEKGRERVKKSKRS